MDVLLDVTSLQIQTIKTIRYCDSFSESPIRYAAACLLTASVREGSCTPVLRRPQSGFPELLHTNRCTVAQIAA